MKQYRIEINSLKPISINKAYYSYNNNLTVKARAFREEFLRQLNEYRILMADIRKSFDSKSHVIVLDIFFILPYKELITKSNEISMLSGDVDNYNKLLLDFLCNPKYMDRDMGPFVASNLAIDDKYICSLQTSKLYTMNAKDYKLIFDIKIVNRAEYMENMGEAIKLLNDARGN